MTATGTATPGTDDVSPPARRHRSPLRLPVLLPLLLLLTVGVGVWRFAVPDGPGAYVVPQNAAIEAGWGIRFNQIDVVGDGGLVELGYTVLDGERASRFQSDTHHPPLLRSEARDATVSVSALMKQGHDLRPGQTYFVIYENPHNTIRSGETVTVEYKGLRLEHTPAR